jgi:hypothetical protein
MCYSEVQFLATVSQVKAYGDIPSAKSVTSALLVIPTVVECQWTSSDEEANFV